MFRYVQPRALSAAAQGKVDVLPEEGRQGHVPAFPELRNGKAPVGRVEVDGQPQSQQPGAAGSKVAIPGKVEVKLKRVAKDHAPRGQGRQLREAAPAVVHQHAQIVRQQHLFGKAETDGVQTGCGILGQGRGLPQLGEEILRLQDGTRGHRGEKEAVGQVFCRSGDL